MARCVAWLQRLWSAVPVTQRPLPKRRPPFQAPGQPAPTGFLTSPWRLLAEAPPRCRGARGHLRVAASAPRGSVKRLAVFALPQPGSVCFAGGEATTTWKEPSMECLQN